jgi:3-oxoacyl-[acyl-carrier-protein] synthase II
MRKQRVVITGMGAVSPYGEGVGALMSGMRGDACALRPLPEYSLHGLSCRVAGLVPPLDERRIPRDLRRTMSPMSIFACFAAWEALEQAGVSRGPALPHTGVAVGSTLGSPQMLHEFFDLFLRELSVESMRSTVFFKVMGHTVAANVALACGCNGRTLAPSAACASGLMGICLGYEAIAAGREERMLCGGADEFHLLTPATFDRLGAASHEADPAAASRPFDTGRSGIVCGEGAGILFLESLESALARKARVLAEIRGASIVSSPANIAHPDAKAIADCMQRALHDASLPPHGVGYVNAHATATEYGDIAEGQAIQKIFGSAAPVSSLKGHMGHTMAACGALESIICVEMLRGSVYFPTLKLENPDARCGDIAHLRTQAKLGGAPVLKNSFALGGCNCTVIFDTFHKDGAYEQ